MGKRRETKLRSTRTPTAKRKAGTSSTKKLAVLSTTTTAFPEKATVASRADPEAPSAMAVVAE